jgi:hypothetical protein
MTEKKDFGSPVGLAIIMGIIVAAGIGFFLFAVLYKLLTTGHLCATAAIHGADDHPPPVPNTATLNRRLKTGARDTRPDAVERAYLQSLPEDEESHPPTEVAAIIIPVKMKVPKQGRTIITPRADVLNTAVVAVDARAYESDLESNASERSNAPPQRRATPALIPQVVARDHRAPDWYDDDVGAPPVTTTSANNNRTGNNNQPPASAALDHRAPDWYND